MNSTGSAVRENEAYMQGLEASVNKFKSAWEAFSNSVVNSDFVKLIINLGTGALKGLNSDLGVTITQIGLLTGVGTGAISLLSKFGTSLVEGVTAFKKLNEAASTTTGILAGIGGLAPVIALALAGITTAVIAGYSAWKQYDEVANGAVNAFNDTVNSANTTLQKHNAEMYVTIDEANDLVNQLDELNKVSSLNNAEQQRYSTIVQR